MLKHIHVARFASRHNLNFLVQASDWFTGRSSQLGGGKTSFASFQNVEGSSSKSKLKSLKEGVGLCNSEKQPIWWDWGWSGDTYGIGDMPWKDLGVAYLSLKDAVQQPKWNVKWWKLKQITVWNWLCWLVRCAATWAPTPTHLNGKAPNLQWSPNLCIEWKSFKMD